MKQVRRLVRKKIRLITNVVLVFLILGFFYAALNSSFAHRYYASILREKTGWSIEVESLKINPFVGSVRLRNASVHGPEQNQLMAVGYVYVRVSPLSLFRGKIMVSRLELRDAYLSFDKKAPTEEEGPAKLTIDYISELSGKIANSFALQNIEVDDGNFSNVTILIQKKDGDYTTLEIGKFQFSIEQSIWRRLNFLFAVEDFFINENVVAEKLDVDSVLSDNSVTVKSFHYVRPEGTYDLALDAVINAKSIDGDIKLTAEMPKVFQKTLHGTGKLRLTPPYLYLKPFTATAGDLTVTPTAQMHLPTGAYQIDVDEPMTELEVVWAAFKLPILEDLQGRAAIKGQLKATLPHFKAQAQLSGESIRYADIVNSSAVEANVDIEGKTATWKAAIPHAAAAQLTSEGRVTLLEGGSLQLEEMHIQTHQLPLDQFLLGENVAGKLSGQFDIVQKGEGFAGSGDFTKVDGRWGSLPVEKVRLAFAMEHKTVRITEFSATSAAFPPVAFTAPLEIQLGDEVIGIHGQPFTGLDLKAQYLKGSKQFKLDSLRYEKAGDVLTASGSYQADKTFNAQAKGSFDAALLQYVRAIFNEAKGGLLVDLKASGAVTQPQVTGTIQAKRVTMSIRGFGDSISDFNGRMIINQNRVTLEKFQGQFGDGDFKLTGTIGLQEFLPHTYDVKLSATGLSYRVRGTMQLDLDTDLAITGTQPSPLVAGRIDVIAGRYYKNFNIAKKVFQERGLAAPPKEFGTDFFNEWRWNIKVRNSGDLEIENNMADVYLTGDLHLKGTTERPIIEGEVTTAGGELFYLGRKLDIVEGRLEFQNPNRINPYLYFEATREVQGSASRGIRAAYTVYVRVEGPLDNLQVKLTSSPPVDQADIVSLLAFGATQSELREQGSSQSAFATSAIASSLASGFGSSLGDSVGLDIVRFETNQDSQDQAVQGIALGKELSDRLTIEFYTDIAPEDAQRRIRSKYFLTDNIFLEGTNTVSAKETRFELNVSTQFKIR